MSFDLDNYRVQLAGLQVLVAELSEIHDHIRDLCSEKPSQLHRATLSSFGSDLVRCHRQADISLALLKLDLKKDKESISALMKVYRKDHYVYGRDKPSPASPDTSCLACEGWQIPWADPDLPHTCDGVHKAATPFDF